MEADDLAFWAGAADFEAGRSRCEFPAVVWSAEVVRRVAPFLLYENEAMSSTPSNHRPIVAIPARNEEERLPQLLHALAHQKGISRGISLPVVVILNNCTDRSAAVAAAEAARSPLLAIDIIEVEFADDDAHVGSARRLAMEQAALSFNGVANGVILTTDADAVPPPNWVAANLRAIADGADIVGGRICGDPNEERELGQEFCERAAAYLAYSALKDHLASLVDPLPYDPWPRHWDHTGASLALRADVYREVGGLRPLPRREDLDLVTRVRAAGYKLRHAPEVVVRVSARLNGRAQGGMADCLKSWIRDVADGHPVLVEDPTRILQRLVRRRQIRDLGALPAEDRRAAAQKLGFDASLIADMVEGQLSPVALIERIAADDPDAPATVPAEVAMTVLERHISEREGASVAA